MGPRGQCTTKLHSCAQFMDTGSLKTATLVSTFRCAHEVFFHSSAVNTKKGLPQDQLGYFT